MANLREIGHFVRFGSHNEQVYFNDELSKTYAGLVFNANLVAWSSSGIAGYLCENNLVNKSFFIDPLTHAFQHDPSALLNSDNEIKPSIQRIIEAYGDPISALGGGKAVTPNDFDDDGLVKEFTKRVIEFQKNTIQQEAEKEDTWDILQFKYGDKLDLKPIILIPPYFILRKQRDLEWIEKNIQFLSLGLEYEGDGLVAGQLVLTREVILDSELRNNIIERYSGTGLNKILLWVDSFSEHLVGTEELEALKSLCVGFHGNNIQVINLYGGFYSIMLSRDDGGPLAGLCHGPQYGEDRPLTPVGGGLPTARFYLYPLHARLPFNTALRILQEQGWLSNPKAYFENVCDCKQCRDLIGEFGVLEGFLKYGKTKPITFKRGSSTVSMSYPLRETQVFATKHYMYSKKREVDFVMGNNKNEIINHISNSIDIFSKNDTIHLINWRDALND